MDRKLFVWLCVLLLGGGGLVYGGLHWLNATAGDRVAAATPQAQARQLVEARGCLACHALEPAPGIGPSWAGSWGAERRFADGSSALVDAAYLREAMLDPAARIVEGYDKVMLPTGFTEAELALVIDFIRGLGATGGTTD